MNEQAFQSGDLVRVADNLGTHMSHFQSGCDAIVVGSYADQYRGDDRNSYTIHIKGSGRVSWYRASQLTLIERGRVDLIAEWEAEAAAKAAKESDLDWVFANGSEVLKSASGSSVAALAGCTVGELWGSRGEGFTYYENALAILAAAEPYLKSGDKSGWLVYRATV